jgi:predicted ABC-type ATPase
MRPNVYIIAGPNGAGKTTFAKEFLPSYAECKNFVNADLIAQGVSPFSPETAAVRAGKLMLQEIDHLARRGVDFGFETTLSGRAHLNLIRHLKTRRYGVNFFYLWLPSVEVALSRVRERVSGGGHNIAEHVVCRRFDRSIRNFLVLYRTLADSWTLFNNSDKMPSVIAFEKESKLRKIDEELFNRLLRLYGQR